MATSNFSMHLLVQFLVPTQYLLVQGFYLILVCILGVVPILSVEQRVNDFVGTESTFVSAAELSASMIDPTIIHRNIPSNKWGCGEGYVPYSRSSNSVQPGHRVWANFSGPLREESTKCVSLRMTTLED